MNMIAILHLSTGEVVGLTVIAAFIALLVLAFLAYVINGQDLPAIQTSGILGLSVQILLALFVGYGLVMLMADKVISSEAGLPALTGLAGVVVGKGTSAK